jgi:hypothetical protein
MRMPPKDIENAGAGEFPVYHGDPISSDEMALQPSAVPDAAVQEFPFYSMAIYYRDRGLRVIPVIHPVPGDKKSGKMPDLKNWPDAVLSEAEFVRRWANDSPYNIGIVLGKPSNTVVLEFDSPTAFEKWKLKKPEAAALTMIVQRNNAEPGRCHVYFFLAPDQPAPKSENRSVLKGWEVRSTGCQIVAPPSIHYSGGTYEFLNGNEPIQWREEYHPEFGEKEDNQEPEKKQRIAGSIHQARPSTPEDADLARECLKHLKPERAEEYDTWLRVGMILKNSGCSVEEWIEWSRNSSKFVEGECEKKWEGFTNG